MSLGIALRVVREELVFAEENGYNVLHITFMGGEPFLNFPVIKCAFEWLEQQNSTVRVEAAVTTNGTVLTPEIKTWLTDRVDRFKVQLSYDGSDSIQARNRSAIPLDLEFFSKTYPQQGVHITVEKLSLAGLSARVLVLLRRGIRCSINLACGTLWSEDDALIYMKELRSLGEACLSARLGMEWVPVLSRSLEGVGSPLTNHGRCRDCEDFNCVDVDGRRYPCHLFSPLVLGEEGGISMAQYEKDEDFRCLGGRSDDICRQCPLCSYCPTCYGFNYLFAGDTSRRDYSVCKMMFAQAIVASEFQVRYFSSIGVSKSNASMAGAAVRAYRVLAKLGAQQRQVGTDPN